MNNEYHLINNKYLINVHRNITIAWYCGLRMVVQLGNGKWNDMNRVSISRSIVVFRKTFSGTLLGVTFTRRLVRGGRVGLADMVAAGPMSAGLWHF